MKWIGRVSGSRKGAAENIMFAFHLVDGLLVALSYEFLHEVHVLGVAVDLIPATETFRVEIFPNLDQNI